MQILTEIKLLHYVFGVGASHGQLPEHLIG